MIIAGVNVVVVVRVQPVWMSFQMQFLDIAVVGSIMLSVQTRMRTVQLEQLKLRHGSVIHVLS